MCRVQQAKFETENWLQEDCSDAAYQTGKYMGEGGKQVQTSQEMSGQLAAES